jgi:O-antigen biosynthesis protein
MASYDVPRDDRDAGARRLFDLTVFLKEAGWSIDFVAANGTGDPRHVHLLQQWGVAVHDDSGFTVAPDKQGSASVVDLLTRVNTFDLAIFAFWPIAELYLPLLRQHDPSARIVVDSVDLHFLRDARRILNASSGGQAPPLLDADFATQMIGELNAYLAADAVMTVSDK